MHRHEDLYYALCEGSRISRIAPSVLAFRITRGRLKVVAHQVLPVLGRDWPRTGGHHLTLDDAHGHVYVGTAAGWVYTLSMKDLRLLYRTEAGDGCGHVTLCSNVGLGVTTNHTDTFMTVIDLKSGRRVRDIMVSSPSTGNAKTQGHTSFWDPAAKRLYSTAAQDGLLIEIDPVAGVVSRRTKVEDADLIQGCVIKAPGDHQALDDHVA